MTNKPLSKLLSVILTLAICATTILGCLITVNAVDGPNYSITAQKCENGAESATATVEFNVPSGMAAGSFTIDNENNWYSAVDVSCISDLDIETDKIKVTVSKEDDAPAAVIFTIKDVDGEFKNYTTITFEMLFTFSSGITEDTAITLSDLEFSDALGDYNTYSDSDFTNNTPDVSFTVGCQHNFVALGEPEYVNEELDYSVYSNAQCSICGEVKNDYQVVPNATPSKNMIYSGTPDTNLQGGGTADNPYLITSADQFAAVALGKITTATDSTYFKVDDGIGAFYLNGGSKVAAMTNVADVKAYFTDEANQPINWSSTTAFKGHFDGNGVTVYGLYHNNSDTSTTANNYLCAGLFPQVAGYSSIKNISLKNSYILSKNDDGAIAGIVGGTKYYNKTTSEYTSSNGVVAGVDLENIAVINNYIARNTATNYYGASAVAGRIYNRDYASINNCIVYGNEIYNAYNQDGKIAVSGLITQNSGIGTTYNSAEDIATGKKIQNVIALDVAPWSIGYNGSSYVYGSYYMANIYHDVYNNIYTNQNTDILNAYDQQANANWLKNEEEFLTRDNINTSISVESLKGATAKATAPALDWLNVWKSGNAGEYPTISPRNNISVYNATNTSTEISQYDSAKNTYIISNANELYALLNGTATYGGTLITTAGANFEVADGIDAFYMNGGDTVAELSNTSAVQSYFENAQNTKTALEGNVNNPFQGTFNGNGAVVYGLYVVKEHWLLGAGLFPKVAGDVTIKNIAVRNSYLKGQTAGGIVGTARTNKLFTNVQLIIEGCESSNNYISATGDLSAGGLVGNMWSDEGTMPLTVNNCLVYGNALSSTAGKTCTAVGGSFNGTNSFSNSILLGYAPFNTSYATYAADKWNNCYTDQNVEGVNDQTYTGRLTTVDLEDIKGSAAESTVSALNAANGDGAKVWYVGKTGEYPTPFENFDLTTANNTNYGCKLVAYNITYQENGKFSLNFYYYGSSNAQLYFASKDESKKAKSYVLSTPTASGNQTLENAKMFTINNLSAQDIDTVWLPTIVTKNDAGDQIIYGESMQTSIKGYAQDVINGNAHFTAGNETADKNVAASLLYYGDTAKAALATTTPNAGEVLVYDTKTPPVSLLDTTKENSVDNPYIINDPNQLHALAAGSLLDINQNDVTKGGYYFKVADGIKAFVMQTAQKHDAQKIMSLSSAQEVEAFFGDKQNTTDSTMWWESIGGATAGFNGHFDGNGVEIYGICSNTGHAGLFPVVFGSPTIKNVVVKNSYFKAGNAGGLVGCSTVTINQVAQLTEKVTFENCEVYNNYIYCTTTSGRGAGGLIGNTTNGAYQSLHTNVWYIPLNINNCLVYGNELGSAGSIECSAIGGIFGNSVQENSAYVETFSNSVFLDYVPYLTSGNSGTAAKYSNCYTDQTITASKYTDIQLKTVTQTTGASAKEAMPALDWDNNWAYGVQNGYPSIVSNSKAKQESVVVYSGTASTAQVQLLDTTKSNSVENPYIIENPVQLHALAAGCLKDTNGTNICTTENYYKVKDGIKAFVLQTSSKHTAEEIMSLSSAEEVKNSLAYVSGNVPTTWWPTTGDGNGVFRGHLDGNGVEIYGLYSGQYNDTGSYAGATALFSKVAGNVSIKNLTVKNSYISTNGWVGPAAIVGTTSNTGDTVTIQNCEASNNYIKQNNASGTIGASAIISVCRKLDTVAIDNCLVYGNLLDNTAITNQAGISSGIIAYDDYPETRSVSITNVVAIGVTPYTLNTGGNLRKLDSGVFNNVYTDQDCSGMTNYSELNKATYNFNDNIALNTFKGDSAADIIAELNTNNGTAAEWFVGAQNDYPSIIENNNMTSIAQALYNLTTATTHDNYGSSTNQFGVYSTSINLNTNPYMGFTFAFHGEYKTSRDKITVTFTDAVTGNVIETVNVADQNGLCEGWTNSAAAGRYHLYRLKAATLQNIANGIQVSVTYSGGEAQDFGTYSVSGFALDADNLNRKIPCDYYASRYEAAKALLFYVQMLNARYGN